MEKNNIWMVVIIALVVAVVVSLVTVKLTGNIVKVPTSVAVTQADVYTKGDVDLMLNNLIGKFQKSKVIPFEAFESKNVTSCAQVCIKAKAPLCVAGLSSFHGNSSIVVSTLIGCGNSVSPTIGTKIGVSCVCTDT